MKFLKRLQESKPLIIDGAMGTLLFNELPGYNGSFELLNVEKPEIIQKVHKMYVDAGVDILETNTFGGSTIKLEEFGLADRCEEINEKGIEAARKAAGNSDVLVGGSAGPTGMLIEPMGEASSEKVYNSFVSQFRGMENGGADLIVIETMNDIQEAKLALLAAKDTTALPVICSMTFEENAKTVTGTDIITAFATLSQLGADMVGANCSMGPEGLVRIFKENMSELEKLGIPFSVWSNAGMPELIDGETVYRMTPETFAETSVEFAKIGHKVIGGCCGTTPEHIKALKNRIYRENLPSKNFQKSFKYITSRIHRVNPDENRRLLVIGERLNPTARKKFAEDLKAGKQNFLREESKKQAAEGAHILDINVGVPVINETEAIHRSIVTLSNTVKTPLMIDSDNKEVLEKALITYPGTAILNSINGTSESINSILPVIKRFGCFAIALCLDDTGIHRESEKRIETGERLIQTLEAAGVSSDRIFIDPLMLAESAEPGSAVETLKVIKHFSNKGIKTAIGLSNVSFGLPQRKHINNVFLNLAIEKGLTAAIVNPAAIKMIDEYTEEEKLAYNFLTGKDRDALAYIDHFKNIDGDKTKPSVKKETTSENIITKIYNLVIDGNSDEIEDAIESAIADHSTEEIMDSGLLAALEKVGDLYSSGEYFLPQMIASANAMKKGFLKIKPFIKKDSNLSLGKVIICTVKGDIHDIGKNIVAVMFENHGFEVHDLGKNVSSDIIVKKAVEIRADLVCLSSLLTTTMGEMKVISEALKKEIPSAKLLIGGAVVNQDYADSIGAFYGSDAVDGVKMARNILSE